MTSKVKLYKLEEDGDEPRSMGKINSKEDELYASLRERLEKSGAIPWLFEFWDAEEEERIVVPLEALNTYGAHVYVVKKGSGGPTGLKRLRVGDDGMVSSGSAHGVEDTADIPNAITVSVEGAPQGPSANSRVDGDSNGEAVEGLPLQQWLTSSLIAADLMERYADFERKTRKELKNRDMEDHDWVLKSFDKNGVAIVKLHCLEFGKDCGGSSGKHSKNAVSNLFNNFKNSHVVTKGHIRQYCRKKGIPYEPQSGATSSKGKSSPTLTPIDHKEFVEEGIRIIDDVNDTCNAKRPLFAAVGGFGDVDNSVLGHNFLYGGFSF